MLCRVRGPGIRVPRPQLRGSSIIAEPITLKVEKRDDDEEQQQSAVEARALEDVCGEEKEEEVEWGGVGEEEEGEEPGAQACLG